MELDLTLVRIDPYRITKEDIIQILCSYRIQCSEQDTVAELRHIISTLRQVLRAGISDPTLTNLTKNVLYHHLPLTEQQKRSYPLLATLEQHITDRQHKYDDVHTDSDPENEVEPEQHTLTPQRGPNVYEEIIPQQQLLPLINQIQLNNTNMAENLPLISAGQYSGLTSENPNDFIDKFDLAATSNKWTDQTKLNLFPAHLAGTALAWYKLYKTRQNEAELQWPALSKEFITAFTPLAQAQTLQAIIDKKIQGEHEPALNYFLDVLTTCRRYEPNITEPQIIQYVIQGLKPDICARVLTYTNDTLTNLENNLKISEIYILAQTQNREKYAREVTRKQTSKEETIESICTLQSQIATLTTLVANLQNQRPPIPSKLATPPSPRAENFYPKRMYSPHRISLNHQKHVQFQEYSGPRVQKNTPAFHKSPETQPKYCSICKKNNHNTEYCWFKKTSAPLTNPARNLFCNYCKRTNHTIQNCYRSKFYKSHPQQKNEQ